ncbi:unnamed protein product [Calicophoron daubneyi]|uniref:Sodium/calcium exchanger membrane region domain-containing protein n=1 Tax=Calicophoron daubneyi TaxID=300641 RepID=A0AAV2U0R4_CALDB
MFFNPRLDAFWRTWCHNHPTCCPRAHHTETEELEFIHQHTGAFGHTAEEAVEKGQQPADVLNVGYEQFTSVQEDYRYRNTIGVTLHIPDTIMGLTFIAAGSSVPDAITSVLVVREGEGDMAVSNAIGSNVFDILICMGLPWFLKCVFSGLPVVIYSKGMLYATLTLFTTVLFLVGATHMNRWRLTKTYGIILLVGYIVVLIFCSCYELNLFGTVHLPECPLVERR